MERESIDVADRLSPLRAPAGLADRVSVLTLFIHWPMLAESPVH